MTSVWDIIVGLVILVFIAASFITNQYTPTIPVLNLILLILISVTASVTA